MGALQAITPSGPTTLLRSQPYLPFPISTPNLPCPAPIHHSNPVPSRDAGQVFASHRRSWIGIEGWQHKNMPQGAAGTSTTAGSQAPDRSQPLPWSVMPAVLPPSTSHPCLPSPFPPGPARPGHLSPFPPARVHPCRISHQLDLAHPWHMHDAAGLAAGCDGPSRWGGRWDGSRERGPGVGAGWGAPRLSRRPRSPSQTGSAAAGWGPRAPHVMSLQRKPVFRKAKEMTQAPAGRGGWAAREGGWSRYRSAVPSAKGPQNTAPPPADTPIPGAAAPHKSQKHPQQTTSIPQTSSGPIAFLPI